MSSKEAPETKYVTSSIKLELASPDSGLATASVRVQPLPSYFGYIMHNNILMMLDLVAVTEY